MPLEQPTAAIKDSSLPVPMTQTSPLTSESSTTPPSGDISITDQNTSMIPTPLFSDEFTSNSNDLEGTCTDPSKCLEYTDIVRQFRKLHNVVPGRFGDALDDAPLPSDHDDHKDHQDFIPKLTSSSTFDSDITSSSSPSTSSGSPTLTTSTILTPHSDSSSHGAQHVIVAIRDKDDPEQMRWGLMDSAILEQHQAFVAEHERERLRLLAALQRVEKNHEMLERWRREDEEGCPKDPSVPFKQKVKHWLRLDV